MADLPYLKTSDLNLAATLYALGNAIDGIYYSGEGERMDFYFADTEQIRTTMKDYVDRKLRVEPNLLLWSRREIVNRMKNEARRVPNETSS